MGQVLRKLTCCAGGALRECAICTRKGDWVELEHSVHDGGEVRVFYFIIDGAAMEDTIAIAEYRHALAKARSGRVIASAAPSVPPGKSKLQWRRTRIKVCYFIELKTTTPELNTTALVCHNCFQLWAHGKVELPGVLVPSDEKCSIAAEVNRLMQKYNICNNVSDSKAPWAVDKLVWGHAAASVEPAV
ncbi:hypothetical protein JKP88DRAFT_240567 [Tribonema minus]|uniref:Uncharacterized protein n=1 Tax=Tribonema minus TaxID=303371 RepID=A0A835ZIQ6_9STRA|nr:hypothetical protein JKP88DRAFT_240567 [Tribonema minus]